MVEESAEAIEVAAPWRVTSFRFAVGCRRIYVNPEVGRVGLGVASLWLSRRMGFDILIPLSGIDAQIGAMARNRVL